MITENIVFNLSTNESVFNTQIWEASLSSFPSEAEYIFKPIEPEAVNLSSIWLKTELDQFQLVYSTGIFDLIVHFLSQVSEIQKIYCLKETDNSVIVWSLLSPKTRDIRKKVYAKERDLIDFFKETLFFDFRLGDPDSSEELERSDALLVHSKSSCH